MEGLNIRVRILAKSQDADDVVGGSVRSEAVRYDNVRARIANRALPSLLSHQGIEGKDLHQIILWPDQYPNVQRDDVVVVISGRHAGARFKVTEVRPSSVLTGLDRAHVQLVAERLRYAHENEPEPFLTGVD